MYQYKVWSKKGRCHLWSYESFKEEIKGIVIGFETTKNFINYVS